MKKTKIDMHISIEIPFGVPIVWQKRNNRIGYRTASKKWLENYLKKLNFKLQRG